MKCPIRRPQIETTPGFAGEGARRSAVADVSHIGPNSQRIRKAPEVTELPLRQSAFSQPSFGAESIFALAGEPDALGRPSRESDVLGDEAEPMSLPDALEAALAACRE